MCGESPINHLQSPPYCGTIFNLYRYEWVKSNLYVLFHFAPENLQFPFLPFLSLLNVADAHTPFIPNSWDILEHIGKQLSILHTVPQNYFSIISSHMCWYLIYPLLYCSSHRTSTEPLTRHISHKVSTSYHWIDVSSNDQEKIQLDYVFIWWN
jgi:hypothetical protein